MKKEKVSALRLFAAALLLLSFICGCSDEQTPTADDDTPVTVADKAQPEAEPQTEPTADNDENATKKRPFDEVFKDAIFSEEVPNDVTGNWRMLIYSAPEDVIDYAVEYCNKYFPADNDNNNENEVHFVINKELKTTSVLNYYGGSILDCTTLKYVKGEEKDAHALAGGDLLEKYIVHLDSGEVENLNIITLSDGTQLDIRNLGADITAALPDEYKNSDWYYLYCDSNVSGGVTVNLQIDQGNDDSDAALRLAADCYNISKTVADTKGAIIEQVSVMVMNNHAGVGEYSTKDGEHFQLMKDGRRTEISLS